MTMMPAAPIAVLGIAGVALSIAGLVTYQG